VRTVYSLVSFWVDPSITAWEKGSPLAPNDALQDPNFCDQCKPWKVISLNVLLKTLTQLMDARKSRFALNTPDQLCAKDTRHLTRFVQMAAFKDPLFLDI